MLSKFAWLLMLSMATPAVPPEAESPTPKEPIGHSTVISSGQVIGLDIVNIDGDKVAEVRDLRIDLESGAVAWVVVQSTNVLEIEEKTYAIPWVALSFSGSEGDAVTLNADPSKLMAMSRRLSYMTDEDFARAVDEYYGLGPPFGPDQR